MLTQTFNPGDIVSVKLSNLKPDLAAFDRSVVETAIMRNNNEFRVEYIASGVCNIKLVELPTLYFRSAELEPLFLIDR